ncbi:MAG: glycerophosphodiester phosphodiesterase family protein [Methylovirgula sp.]
MTWRLNAPDWLAARPIAHGGLHDAAQGIVENSLAAAQRAIAKAYAIECDVQLSKDGEAIVFHDETLARLIGAPGEIGALTTPEITRLAYKGSRERIATLADFLATIAGRVPLIVELKSRFDGDPRLAARVAQIAASYAGPLALKSFDPQVLCTLRSLGVEPPLGLVAQACYQAADWPELDKLVRRNLEALVDFPSARPDFLSWHVGDLPHAVPLLCRAGMGMNVLVWTVRSEAERAIAQQWADQIIFEGFEA